MHRDKTGKRKEMKYQAGDHPWKPVVHFPAHEPAITASPWLECAPHIDGGNASRRNNSCTRAVIKR